MRSVRDRDDGLLRCERHFADLFDHYWHPSPSLPSPRFIQAERSVFGSPGWEDDMLTITTEKTFDEARLQELMGKLVTDAGAAATAPLVILGDRLGLYRALADNKPLTSAELASVTGTDERHVREWLAAQAAAGYVTYDGDTDRYGLSAEQAMALADESSPVFFVGAFETIASTYVDRSKIERSFKDGGGVGWHEHDSMLFCGCERFFRAGYSAHLVADWLPALDGVVERLETGITVADVGCGHGASTIIMAQAFPNSRFIGFDYHADSIKHARQAAAEAGIADRVRFEVASAESFIGGGFDFVTVFDALHDMGDPVGAATNIRKALAPGAT